MISKALFSSVWLVVAYSLFLCGQTRAEEPSGSPLAVVKQVRGKAIKILPGGKEKNLEPFDVLRVSYGVDTRENGRCVLRLFATPSGHFAMQPSTKIKLKYKEHSGKVKPHIYLEGGKIESNFSEEAGLVYILESANSVIQSLGSRWLMRFGDEAVSKFVVIQGSLKVYNKPKDMSAVVPEGKTCLSDKDGLHIVNTSDEDIAQFLQHLLEVDFIEPSTDEIKTLEIEYESNF